MKYPEPVAITFSVLAGLQVITAGSTLADVIGTQTAGLIVLIIAGVQAALSFYVRGQVVPESQVLSRVNKFGDVVAGPMSVEPGEHRRNEAGAIAGPGFGWVWVVLVVLVVLIFLTVTGIISW